jgi:CheY-like chemotaxis protein
MDEHRKKILVVDDEQVIVDSVVRLCSDEGIDVDTALDANEAFKKIEHNKYQLIVTDIMMPGIDGFQLIAKLKEDHIRTPVIITTGYSTVENAVKSLYEGAIDFLPKPFTIDELFSSIYRGIRYAGLMDGVQPEIGELPKIDFAPCPVTYYRLGYLTWAKLEDDGSVKIGVTDIFLKTIKTIKKIDLFQLDEEIIQGNTCAQIETEIGLMHNILAPMTGRIIDKNDKLLNNKDLIEKDPYFEGWIYTIIPSDLDYELKHLISCSSDRL